MLQPGAKVEGNSLSSIFTEGLLHFILQKKERRAPEHSLDGPGAIISLPCWVTLRPNSSTTIPRKMKYHLHKVEHDGTCAPVQLRHALGLSKKYTGYIGASCPHI
ncbi:hypothetical protein JZ751_020782 [Albula glossodonta]|uniref:Uncharacterized protein n=1 Tax=Albula glossodonta TaxID=121402 RepID=A0A8T2PJF8_9TELE|nr:hypothetical protein JZ751_020782 [Albula glossodonta]